MLARNAMNAASGEIRQFVGDDALHVATIHVVVDTAHVAHVRSQTFQLFVATNMAYHVNRSCK